MEATYTQCKQLKELHGDSWGDVLIEMADTPPWIDPLTIADIRAIQYGGCASGAYMPAVTYWQALETMGEHGDDIVDYLDSYGLDCIVFDVAVESWSGFASRLLSIAVEVWCNQFDLDGVNWD